MNIPCRHSVSILPHFCSGDARFRVGCASMQGKRSNMEDDHNLELRLPGNGHALFGVYDGHGGEFLQRVFEITNHGQSASSVNHFYFLFCRQVPRAPNSSPPICLSVWGNCPPRLTLRPSPQRWPRWILRFFRHFRPSMDRPVCLRSSPPRLIPHHPRFPLRWLMSVTVAAFG
jgi:hypothetical protein